VHSQQFCVQDTLLQLGRCVRRPNLRSTIHSTIVAVITGKLKYISSNGNRPRRLPWCQTHALIHAIHNRSTVFTMWRPCARPSDTRFLGLIHSQPQMAARSVQPFLPGRCHILPTFHIAPPIFPKFAPHRWGSGLPCNIWFLGPTQPTERHID